MRLLWTYLVIAVIAGIFGTTTPASAQIHGRVSDTAGSPVSAATVQLREHGRTVAFRLTGEDGSFDLPSSDGADSVRVERFGYATTTIPIGHLLDGLAIVLREEPFSLDPLVAIAEASPCPEEGSEEAQRIWEGVRTRYPAPPSASWSARIVNLFRQSGLGDPRGPIPERRVDWAQAGGGDFLIDQWIDRGILRFVRQSRSAMGEREGRWSYPRLDGPDTPLLLSDAFRDAVEFEALESDDPGTSLIACGEGDSGAHLRILFDLDGEGWIREASWEIHSPEGAETVRGTTMFQEYQGVAPRTLLPSRGTYWRQESVGRHYRETQVFGPWFFEGDGRTSNHHLHEYYRVEDRRGTDPL